MISHPQTLNTALDGFDPRKAHGTFDLGLNATGVIESKVHFTGDEVIIEEVMPAHHVQECFDSVARLAGRMRNRKAGGDLVGQIPLPFYWEWRRQWEAGPKQWGMVWRAFLTGKIMDRDWSKFRARNV